MKDVVAYLQPPVGTWDGKQYRVTVDGDAHNFNYRTDVFADADLAKAWKDGGATTEWGVPKTWQEVQAVTKFLKGKQFKGQDVFGYLDAPKAWGGFGFYFLGSRASAYAKHPDDKAWLFDADTMSPGFVTPTLSASAPASIVPHVTGVPTASPVAAAAPAVTCPAMSVVHSNFGSLSSGRMSSASSSLQSSLSTT